MGCEVGLSVLRITLRQVMTSGERGPGMAEESLVEAFDRLGIGPLPSVDEMRAMGEDERRAALAESSVSGEQFEQLPGWYREKLRRRAEEGIARRGAEQAAARRVS